MPRLDDRARAEEEFNRALQNASGVEERQVAFEAYRQTLVRIDAEEERLATEQAARDAAIAQGGYQRSAARAGERVAAEALKSVQADLIDQLDTMRGVAGNVFTTIVNGFRNGASAGEVLLSIVGKIGDAFIRAGSSAFEQLLFGARGTLDRGVFGGAVSGPTVPATVGVYHQGGVVGATPAPQRSVPLAAVAGAPRYHDGLKPGERFGIFEDGETIVPKGRSVGSTVVNNFYVETPGPRAFAESRASVARAASRLITNAGRHT